MNSKYGETRRSSAISLGNFAGNGGGAASNSRRRTLADIFTSSISSITNSSSNSYRPSPLEASSWSDSIQTLLASKYGKSLFTAFLTQEYSEESIEFYNAVEKYRKAGTRKFPKKAKKIMNKFIREGAPKSINIDDTTRLELIEKMEDLNNADAATFDKVQNRIIWDLEAGSYRRFLEWHVYLGLVQPAHSSSTDSLDCSKLSVTDTKVH